MVLNLLRNSSVDTRPGWRRFGLTGLLALLALCLSTVPTGRAAANQLNEIDDANDARSMLAGWHAYQPIFNGLKSREEPWQERIITEHGARFFTPASVRDFLPVHHSSAAQGRGRQDCQPRPGQGLLRS
jgi:hypothetical protein